MNSGAAGHVSQLEFLGKLQRILNEGVFTASYKYALILAIAELSVEKTGREYSSLHLPLDEIADRFIGFYWRQAAPFAGGAFLHHARGREAIAVTRIRAFQEQAPTLSRARNHRQWKALVRSISRLLVEMPLWKLQRVGADKLDFLYAEAIVDSGIVLRPGVAECFRQQFTVVQALVQMAWLSFVQQLPANRPVLGTTGDLADFLFGSERGGLSAIVGGLRDLQHGECFYCRGRLHETVEVDHFIPWSRYPRDLGHNFVLAHGACNHDKRDMLAAPAHLTRWVERNDNYNAALQQIFDEARFLYDMDASLTVAEWSYETAERAGALVWVRKQGQTARLSGEWRQLFAA
jgi:5-methylcytosine-specific restriction endonuclease McrA